MRTRGSAGVWGMILVAALLCGALGYMRLSGLPDLGVLLGPDLTVRHVAMERTPGMEGQPFQRGDRLIAVEGLSVDELQDLREILPPLLAEAEVVEFSTPGEADQEFLVLDYQIWRPVHRFSLALQGDPIDPTELPPGVEPDDCLFEVDGRLLTDCVGPEAIRSVIASRPDALLGFERPNAVFAGQLKVEPPGGVPGVVLIFLMALAGIVVIWRSHTETVGAPGAYCIAVETICLGWLFLLVVGFQWVLADNLLATAVIVSMVMMRPLAILARQLADRGQGSGGTVAFGLGVVASAGLVGLLFGGYLEGIEATLHAAAIIAGLFIIYEIAVSGMEREQTLKERAGYLSGVVILALFACVVAAVMEPVSFEEDRWRYFAVLIPSLVWFGDMLYAVKYGARSALGGIAARSEREKSLKGYLSEIALEMPHTDLRIVGQRAGQAMCVRRDTAGVSVERVEEALADAVDILIRENARVPLPEGPDRMVHPMEGIAKAMHISIAIPLVAPAGSLEPGGEPLEFALVGMRETRDGEVPAYASTETLDLAQELWTDEVASAAMLELLAGLAEELGLSQGMGPSPELEKELSVAKEAALKCQEEKAVLTEEVGRAQEVVNRGRALIRLRDLTGRELHAGDPADQGLLEAELMDALQYLTSEREPIVIGGPVGAGKSFVAHRAFGRERGWDKPLLVVDTVEPGAAEKIDAILGESGREGLFAGYDGGFLLRGAHRCDDARLLALCHQAEEHGVRLYLSFDSPNAEEVSVLEGRPSTLQELLGHREVIIPHFSRRPGVRRTVLQFWLAEWAYRLEKPVDGFSRMALEALEAYGFPGEIQEAIEIVRLAVLSATHDVVDVENLPARMRDGR